MEVHLSCINHIFKSIWSVSVIALAQACVICWITVLLWNVVGLIWLVVINAFPVNPPLSASRIWGNTEVSTHDWVSSISICSIDAHNPISRVKVIQLLLNEKNVLDCWVTVENVGLFNKQFNFALNIRGNRCSLLNLISSLDAFTVHIIAKDVMAKYRERKCHCEKSQQDESFYHDI